MGLGECWIKLGLYQISASGGGHLGRSRILGGKLLEAGRVKDVWGGSWKVHHSKKFRIWRPIFTLAERMRKVGGAFTKEVGFRVGTSAIVSSWRDE